MSNPTPKKASKKIVDAYKDALKESPLPAVQVTVDGILVYGNHRMEAVRREEEEEKP